MYNHIFLMMEYIDDLKDLAMSQRLIDVGRRSHPEDQEVQLGLDRLQRELISRKIKIQDEMFEIMRSN